MLEGVREEERAILSPFECFLFEKWNFMRNGALAMDLVNYNYVRPDIGSFQLDSRRKRDIIN